MAVNRLRQLAEYGQSFWYDNIRRALLTGGGLKKMIEEDGLRGLTSNPTIFAKAIAGSGDYDDSIRRVLEQTPENIFLELAVEDISAACDLFRPVYEREGGRDGFCSIEVFPNLARDAAGTIAQARELWRRVNRPNVMIKVPSTPECIPAIRQLLTEGININITLMFDFHAYQAVLEAYLSALEARREGRQPLDRLASVASLFVSRVDTRLDKQLEAIAKAKPAQAESARGLLGQTGLANARRMYAHFEQVSASERYKKLAGAGARPQRLLWASTSTKNPNYPDTLYADALVAPHTVDTMPDATVAAFRDHGKPGDNLRPTLDQAAPTLAALQALGVDFERELVALQNEGVVLFEQSFEELIASLQEKAEALRRGGPEGGSPPSRRRSDQPAGAAAAQAAAAPPMRLDAPAANDYAAELEALEKVQTSARIWRHDASLWSRDPAAQEKIGQRLGWLAVSDMMLEHLPALKEFVEGCRRDDLRETVLLGMGGSSLAPEVFSEIFSADRASGGPHLTVLDTTEPAAIAKTAARLDWEHTLFLVSSKSGGTIEPNSLYAFFRERAKTYCKQPGAHFAAITDPGTSLQKLAEAEGFRQVFCNPADIGGRYSALSWFGLVPAALLGIDVERLLRRAQIMEQACAAAVAPALNPGLRLGAALGAWAQQGKDKVTVLAAPELVSFGAWLEQLLAESTGKQGRGLIPVDREPAAEKPAAYGADRVFVRLQLAGGCNSPGEEWTAEQIHAGAPVVSINWRDRYDLGQEFFRWEYATAVAGQVIGINPFDEPNVQESKDNTMRVLKAWSAAGGAGGEKAGQPEAIRDLDGGGRQRSELTAYAPHPAASVAEALRALLDAHRPGDYFALMLFIERTAEAQSLAQQARTWVRDHYRLATTLGYGPRFLHSTGQLHKGGPDSGLFLQLTAAAAARQAGSLPVPGKDFDFATLFQAQSEGDFQSLQAHGRRVLRIDLGADAAAGLRRLLELVETQTAPVSRAEEPARQARRA